MLLTGADEAEAAENRLLPLRERVAEPPGEQTRLAAERLEQVPGQHLVEGAAVARAA